MKSKQQKILKKLQVLDPTKFDAKAEIRKSVDFLKNFIEESGGLKGYTLGISGGQDSTLAGKLTQMAIDELNDQYPNENYQFVALGLPYGVQTDQADVDEALNFIKPTLVRRLNIKSPVDAIALEFSENNETISDFNKGNVKARMRMIYQYAIAGNHRLAVVGTDHAAEAITGFYTKFGDGAADLMPLYRLNKRQGKAMLKVLGAPANLYEKTPTADLEEDRPSLPDTDALGLSYETIDDYLEGKEIPEDDRIKLEAWYDKTNHKRVGPYSVNDWNNRQ